MRTLLIIFGLFLILVLGGIGYFYYQNRFSTLSISVASENPGITVKFLNKDKLLSEMRALGYSKKNGVGLRPGTEVHWTSVSRVNIILTSQPQSWPLTYSAQRQVARSSFDIKSAGAGAINLYLWVEPHASEDLPSRQKFYNRELLRALYTATHWNNNGEDDSPYFSYVKDLDNNMLSTPGNYPITVAE